MTLTFWVCASILVLTQIADYYSTKLALKNPRAREANWVVRKLGLIPSKVGTSVLFVWMSYALSTGPLIAATVVIASFYTWIVLHNLSFVKK